MVLPCWIQYVTDYCTRRLDFVGRRAESRRASQTGGKPESLVSTHVNDDHFLSPRLSPTRRSSVGISHAVEVSSPIPLGFLHPSGKFEAHFERDERCVLSSRAALRSVSI